MKRNHLFLASALSVIPTTVAVCPRAVGVVSPMEGIGGPWLHSQPSGTPRCLSSGVLAAVRICRRRPADKRTRTRSPVDTAWAAFLRAPLISSSVRTRGRRRHTVPGRVYVNEPRAVRRSKWVRCTERWSRLKGLRSEVRTGG